MLVAQAAYAPGLTGEPARFCAQLDCLQILGDREDEFGKTNRAVLAIDMVELKRVHARMGRFLAGFGDRTT